MQAKINKNKWTRVLAEYFLFVNAFFTAEASEFNVDDATDSVFVLTKSANEKLTGYFAR